MIDPSTVDVTSILPHRAPMLLLDRIVAHDGDRTVASWCVDGASPWVRDGVLDAAALLEVAAQTAAAGAGLRRRERGLPPEVGYLGAVAGFRVRDEVRAGDRLVCQASVRFRVGRLVRVEVSVERDGAELASGELSLAVSPDPVDGEGA